MIRKAIINLLIVATILSLVMGALSYIPTTAWPAPMTPMMSKAGFPLPGYYVWFALGDGIGDGWYLLEVRRGWACMIRMTPLNQVIPTTTDTTPVYVRITPQIFLPLMVVLLATYPVVVFIRGPLRRWRRQRKGLCLNCGYNLTGNTTGICSECGEKITR